MTIVVLLVLAGIWTAVLLPPYLEKRRSVHPSTSIVDFHHKLAVLQRTGDPYAPLPVRPTPGRSMTRNDALRRRRDVLATLAAAAVLSFLLAAATGGASVWLLHLTIDAALLGYVALLMQVQQQRAVGMRRPAPMRRPVHAPAFAAATAYGYAPVEGDYEIDLTAYEPAFVDDPYAEVVDFGNVYEFPVGRPVAAAPLRRAN